MKPVPCIMPSIAGMRGTIFRKEEDYEAFERILAEGLERYEVRLLGYELMPNHWHLVLRPDVDGEMSRSHSSLPHYWRTND